MNAEELSRPEEVFAALRTPEGMRDPYPLYNRLRTLAPVHRGSETAGLWYVSGYEDCSRILKSYLVANGQPPLLFSLDPRFQKSAGLQWLSRMLFFLDPPDHRRIHQVVSRAFNTKLIDSVGPRVQQLVDQVIADVARKERFDVIGDVGRKIAGRVICGLLGVPEEDEDRVLAWIDVQARQALRMHVSDSGLQEIEGSVAELSAYLGGLIDERQRQPREDVLSELAAELGADGQLTLDELVSVAGALIGAGTGTTEHVIGAGVLWLLRNPEELLRLRADESLDRPAVEEFIRFDGPAQVGAVRFATQDIQLEGGVTIAAGEGVVPVLAAANRDPGTFDRPDVFDVARRSNPHLGFHPGVRMCLGTRLARAEIAVCVPQLMRAFPNLSLAAEPVWALAAGENRVLDHLYVTTRG